jgi:hypothetical protein
VHSLNSVIETTPDRHKPPPPCARYLSTLTRCKTNKTNKTNILCNTMPSLLKFSIKPSFIRLLASYFVTSSSNMVYAVSATSFFIAVCMSSSTSSSLRKGSVLPPLRIFWLRGGGSLRISLLILGFANLFRFGLMLRHEVICTGGSHILVLLHPEGF